MYKKEFRKPLYTGRQGYFGIFNKSTNYTTIFYTDFSYNVALGFVEMNGNCLRLNPSDDKYLRIKKMIQRYNNVC